MLSSWIMGKSRDNNESLMVYVHQPPAMAFITRAKRYGNHGCAKVDDLATQAQIVTDQLSDFTKQMWDLTFYL